MSQFNPVKSALDYLNSKYRKQLSILKEKANEQTKEIEQSNADKEYEEKLRLFKERNSIRVDVFKENNEWSNEICLSINQRRSYKYNESSFKLEEIDQIQIERLPEEKLQYLRNIPSEAIARFPEYNNVDTSKEKVYNHLKMYMDEELQLHQKFLNEYEDFLNVYFPEIKELYAIKLNEFNNYINSRIKFYTNEHFVCYTGLYGEQQVRDTLSIHTNLITLQNIRIELNGESSENDFIILSTRGIFTSEVKNYAARGQYDIVIDSSGNWTGRYKDGKVIPLELNPQEQSSRHVAFLNNLINHCLGRTLDNYIEVKDVIIVPSKKPVIENNSPNQTVIRNSDIYNFIQGHPIIFNQSELSHIETILRSYNLGPEKKPLLDFQKEMLSNIEVFRKNILPLKKMIEASSAELQELKLEYNQEESA